MRWRTAKKGLQLVERCDTSIEVFASVHVFSLSRKAPTHLNFTRALA